MSTKIYDGIRFREADLAALHAAMMALRPGIRAVQAEMENKLIANLATSAIDDAAAKSTNAEAPAFNAWTEVEERRRKIKTTGRRDPAVDFDLSLMVLPFEGKIYGLVFTDCKDVEEFVMAAPWIEPWPYWDNTDADESVTDEEWTERGKTWTAIFAQDPHQIPAGCGFSIEMNNISLPPAIKNILPHVPSMEKRLRRVATNAARNEHAKAIMDGTAKNEDPLTVFRIVQNWLETDDGKASIDKHVQALRERLPIIDEVTLARGTVVEPPSEIPDDTRSPA